MICVSAIVLLNGREVDGHAIKVSEIRSQAPYETTSDSAWLNIVVIELSFLPRLVIAALAMVFLSDSGP